MTTFAQTKEKLVTFARAIIRAQSIREAQTATADDYTGCEVIEQFPSGSHAVAIITHIVWEQSVIDPKTGLSGDWMIGIRYLHDGSQAWVGQTALTLTGERYENIDAVRPLHPAYRSTWSK